MRPGRAIRPDQEHHAAAQPAQTLQALLTVGFAGVFFGQHRCIKDAAALSKINAVLADIGLAFCFIKSDHSQIVLTI